MGKDFRGKVVELFKEYVGESADRLSPYKFRSDICNLAAQALEEDFGKKRAHKIAFHLFDWHADAAFIVALVLWPEKFTKDEISQAIYTLMHEAPDHLAASAKLFGCPVTDVFEVGALDGDDE